MQQLNLLDPSEPIFSAPQVFSTTRSRAKDSSSVCAYCRGPLGEGDTVWTEQTTRAVGCCHACAVSAAKIWKDHRSCNRK